MFGRSPRPLRVLAAVVFAGLVLPAVVAAPSASASAAPKGVYVVQSGTETWSDAMNRQIADYPSFRTDVAALLPAWTAHAKQGAKLGLGVNGGPSELDQLARVSAALQHPGSYRQAPASSSKAAASPMFVNPNDPNHWPVRGNVGANGNTYWSNLLAIVSVDYCGPNGCRLTDTFSSRSQVNPGAVSDRISITQAYYPDGGEMWRTAEYKFYSINRGTITGTGYTYLTSPAGKTGASGAWTQGNGKNLKGTVLTVAVGMGIVVYPPPYNGATLWDGSKTPDATCNSSGTVCHY